MRKTALIIVLIFFNLSIFAIDYTTTAESVSWNGAYTSISDGFEAMLYNPAGIYLSPRRFGLNILGSYGFRFYNNTFSTDDIIDTLAISSTNDRNITPIINKKLNLMPEFGMDTGISARNVSLMTFMRFNNFSIGISLINKFDGNFIMSKSIFKTVMQNLDLSKPLKASMKSNAMLYSDLNFSISSRVPFIEKVLPVEAIYAGASVHLYIPMFYYIFDTDLTFTTSDPDPEIGIYSYHANVKGSLISSGNMGILQAAQMALGAIDTSSIPGILRTLVSNDGTVAWGFGFDMGFIVKINSLFRIGLGITDLGFFVFPESVIANYDFDVTISPTRFQEFAKDFAEELEKNLNNEMVKSSTASFFIPDTAVRSGVAFTPIKNKNFDLLFALDLSVSNFNKLIVNEYVTFNFSTGLEVRPKAGFFEFPIRTAFNYNSQANVASISLGSGLHIGPMKMVIGIKGLEILISDWGAKEFSFGVDFNFEF